MTQKIKYTILCILIGSIQMIGQQADLSMLQEALGKYKDAPFILLDMEVRMNDGGSAKDEVEHIYYQKKDNWVYTKSSNNEMMINDDAAIVLDHHQKIMLFSKLEESLDLSDFTPQTIELDSILNNPNVKYSLVDHADGQIHYRATYSESIIDRVDMWIDVQSRTLQSLTYHYKGENNKKGSSSTLIIKRQSTNASDFQPSYFLTNTYAIANGNKYKLAQQFEDFEFYDTAAQQ